MVCRTTSTNSRVGFTLLELLVTLGVGLIISTATIVFAVYASRTLALLSNRVDMERASRETLDYLSRELRTARTVSCPSAHELKFVTPDSTECIYEYSPTAKTLSRRAEGQTHIWLSGCDALTFTLYQAPSSKANFGDFKAVGKSTPKLVEASWTLTRPLAGSTVVQQSQSGRIVLRTPP
jgi:prepilin-type N-terminal cleavage/methylation domain-containing protein